MPERVLCLTGAAILCEEARYVRHLVEGLTQRGHEVLCFAPEGGAAILGGEEEAGGGHPTPAGQPARSPSPSPGVRRWWAFGSRVSSLLYRKEWGRATAGFHPTVLHACGVSAAHVACDLASEFAVPLAVTVPGDPSEGPRAEVRLCRRLADLPVPWKVCVSYRELADELRARIPHVRGRLEVVRPGVRVPPAGEGHEGPRRIPVVGMATGFDGRDGAELLLQAAQCLKRNSVTCEFLIAGEGRHERRLRRHARSLGVRSRVNFVPPLVNLVSALEDLDVVVVVSQGRLRVLSILEAQAAGRAVVATSAPGIEEFVEDGVTGLVVHDGGAPALARSIEELLEDAEFRDQLGAHARQRVIETGDLNRMLERVEGLYASLLVRAGSRLP